MLFPKHILFAAASGTSALAAAGTFMLAGTSTVPIKPDGTPSTDANSAKTWSMPDAAGTRAKTSSKATATLSVGGNRAGTSSDSSGRASQPGADTDERQAVLGAAASAGVVEMTLDKTSNILSLHDMVVGDKTSGELLVRNTGNLPATYTTTGSLGAGSSSLLAGQLKLTVYKTDGANTTTTKVWPPNPTANSSLSAFNSATVSLGRLERPCQDNPGRACDSLGRPMARRFQSRMTLRFEVELASRGSNALDNAMQLLGAEEIFKFTAVEAAGQP